MFSHEDFCVIEKVKGVFRRFVVAWVDSSRRAAVSVLLAAVLATGASLFYTEEYLGINTSTTDMLSRDLPFRQTYEDFKQAFPLLRNNITIVIEGDTPDLAEDAALALGKRLEAESGGFNFILNLADDPFFAQNGLLYLDEEELFELADRLADAQPMLATLAKDMSLRGFFEALGLAVDAVADGDAEPANLNDVFASVSDTIERYRDGRGRPMSWQKLIKGGEVEKDDLRRIILVQPKLDFTSLQPAGEAIAAIREAAADLRLDAEHGVRVRLTGGVVLDEEELQSVSEGVGTAGVIALILVGTLVMIGLRSYRLVGATLITLVMGLIWTAAFATFAVGRLNLISVAFAVLFIGIGVDFGIQFCLRYREEIGRGCDNEDALRETAAGVGGALSLAALAAAIGFLSFVPTSYVGLSELGIISAGGMAIALFANFTVLPALLTLMSRANRPFRPRGGMPMAWEAEWVRTGSAFLIRHARPIASGALLLGLVAGVLFLPLLRFDFDPMGLKDPTTESVRTAFDLMADSDTSIYAIGILADDLDAATGIAERLEALPEVDRALTLASFVPEEQEPKLEAIDGMALFLLPVLEVSSPLAPPDDQTRRKALSDFRRKLGALIDSPDSGALEAEARRLAANLAAIEDASRMESARGESALESLEALLLSSLPGRLDRLRRSLDAREVTIDDLPESLRRRNTSVDGRAFVEVFPSQDVSDNEALRRFVTAVRAIAPEATDSPVMILEGGIAVTTAFKQAGILSFTIITLLLIVVLRSLADTVLVLFPLTLAAVLTAAVSVLLNIPLNFANIIAVPLLFSLGVAYGIYLVLRRRKLASVAEVMATSTPWAILFSALTTICSFGSLMVSSHRGTSSMGQLLTISLTLALVCTLVVLPALLAFRTRLPPVGRDSPGKGKSGS